MAFPENVRDCAMDRDEQYAASFFGGQNSGALHGTHVLKCEPQSDPATRAQIEIAL